MRASVEGAYRRLTAALLLESVSNGKFRHAPADVSERQLAGEQVTPAVVFYGAEGESPNRRAPVGGRKLSERDREPLRLGRGTGPSPSPASQVRRTGRPLNPAGGHWSACCKTPA